MFYFITDDRLLDHCQICQVSCLYAATITLSLRGSCHKLIYGFCIRVSFKSWKESEISIHYTKVKVSCMVLSHYIISTIGANKR